MLKVLNKSEKITKNTNINSFKNILTNTYSVNMNKITKQISIPVTDLSSLCGMDYYNNWSKSICKLWRQVYPDDFEQVLDFVNKENKMCVMDNTYSKIKKLESLTGTTIKVSSKIYKLNQNRQKSTLVLRTEQNKIESDIYKCNKMPDNIKVEMIKLMHSATNVVYGTRNENIGIKEFENRTNKKIKSSQNKLTYSFARDTLTNGNEIEWLITGKYDGLTTDNELIEIKNRQQKLFNTIKDYENCQIQVYLNILDIKKGYLVELIHNNNNPDVNILETSKDEMYITNNILPYLNNVRSFVLNIPYMTDLDKFKLLSGERNKL